MGQLRSRRPARPRAPLSAALTLAAAAVLALSLAAPAAAKASAPRGLAPEAVVRNVRLQDVPGCGSGDFVPGGLSATCVYQDNLRPDETVVVTFNVPAKGTPMDPPLGDFDLMLQLRTVAGSAKMSLVTPKHTPPPSYDSAGGTLYSTLFNSQEFIAVAAEYLLFNTGTYTINITSSSDDVTFFALNVHTPLATSLLTADEVEVMVELSQQCCQTGNAKTSAFCTKYLPAVTRPGRSPEADLCRMPPVTCSAEGRLLQLALPGAGLDCGGKGLPASFKKLTELQILDVAYNEIGGSTADMGALLGALPKLKRAYLRHTNLTGPLNCAMVENPSLQTLSLTGNPEITGVVPACLLGDATLEELFISEIGLTGALPDSVLAGSPLRVIFALGSNDGTQFSGPIPPSISNAKNLVYLDLANNRFEGPVPALPESLKFLDLSNNRLTQLPSSLPAGLESFDAAGNALEGEVPAVGRNLVRVVLDNNRLSGPFPGFMAPSPMPFGHHRRLMQGPASGSDPPALRLASFSNNRLTGSLPQEWATGPKNLQFLMAAGNSLGGTLPRDWALQDLVWIDVSNNMIEGSVPAPLGAQPSLIHVDLSSNRLGGEIYPFAAELADGSQRLAYLNLSNNVLTGPIPPQMGDNNVLDMVAIPMIGSTPVPRVLDLSNNQWSGASFPLWMLEAIPRETADCNGCNITVKVNGPNEILACPSREEAQPYSQLLEEERKLLSKYNFQCRAGNGSDVPLLLALDGSAEGPKDRLPVGQVPGPAYGGGGRGGGMSTGAIVGLVIGLLAGLALLAGGGFFAYQRTRNWRAGYTKETLNGAGAAGGAAGRANGRSTYGGGQGRGGNGAPSGKRVGGGWGARVAQRDQGGGDAFGVMPAPPTGGSRRDSQH